MPNPYALIGSIGAERGTMRPRLTRPVRPCFKAQAQRDARIADDTATADAMRQRNARNYAYATPTRKPGA